MKPRHLFAAAAVLVAAGFVHPRLADEPRRWAVVVGAGDYAHFGDEEGGDLPGAAADARAMRDVLVGRWGFPEEGVHLLLDSAATRERIRYELAEWLPSVAKPGDLVVFYFSGHGSQVFDQNGDEEDGLDETICPTDVLRGSGRMDIRDDELGGWLRALPTRNVTVILDSCHSGTATRFAGPNVRRKALPRTLERPEPAGAAEGEGAARGTDGYGDGVLEISASQAGQYAVEAVFESGSGLPRPGGAFTTPLVRYLWQVPEGTSYQEVFFLTREALRRGNFAQTPQISREGAARPLFGVAGGRAAAAPGREPERRGAGVARVAGLPRHGTVELAGGGKAGMTASSVYRAGSAMMRVTDVGDESARAVVVPGGRVPAVGDAAVLEAYAVPEAMLRVDVTRLPEPARQALAAAGAVPGVLLQLDETAPAHLSVRPDGDAWVVAGADGAVRATIPASVPAQAAAGLTALLRHEQAVLALASIENPAHPFALEFGLAGGQSTFRIGDPIGFRIRAGRDGYLTVVDLDPAGKVTVLYPNAYATDARVRAGQEVLLPSPEMGFTFTVEGPAGRGVVRAFVTERPVELPFTEGDASRAPRLVEALLQAAGAPTGGGPVPVKGWATAAVLYDFTP